MPTGTQLAFLAEYGFGMAVTLAVPMLLLWIAALIYVAGPRAVEWFPALHHVYFRLPARHKRMLRDFSNMLAILLDAGVPETVAVTLAADCTANRVFRARATEVSAHLQRGLKLTEAVAALDDSGEFRWRLRNAAHATGGFRAALEGWHEALDAKAFQLEQAGAQIVTTVLVLLNGVFVGTVVVCVFSFLVSIINGGLLW